jgi:replicative superfamily II helicase
MENFVIKCHGVQLSRRMREIFEAWYKTIAVWVAVCVPTLWEGILKRLVVFEILCQKFFYLNSNLPVSIW